MPEPKPNMRRGQQVIFASKGKYTKATVTVTVRQGHVHWNMDERCGKRWNPMLGAGGKGLDARKLARGERAPEVSRSCDCPRGGSTTWQLEFDPKQDSSVTVVGKWERQKAG